MPNLKNSNRIGVAIITHQAKRHLPKLLPPLLNSPLNPRILLVNSSSNDQTVETAKGFGVECLVIPRKEFNHGRTRELARKVLNTEIVVMMTPDAYGVDCYFLEKLIAPLIERKASAAYARQLPHDNAGFFESFHRAYNYPQKSHIRGIEDIKTYGPYTFFCSNSCAAYLNSALDTIGGFSPVLMGEDTIAVAKLLKAGHKIAYVSEAMVKHSHHYSLIQEFRRHFDIGYFRKLHEDLFAVQGRDAKRGKEYFGTLLTRILKEKPWLFPYALMQTCAKASGYFVGRRAHHFPLWLKKAFSSQDFYWSSTHHK